MPRFDLAQSSRRPMRWNGAVASTRITLSTEEACRAEVERALGMLQAGKEPAEVLEMLSHRLTNKLMHAPLTAASQALKAA